MQRVGQILNSRILADRLDQAIMVGLFVWLCYRLVPHSFPPTHWYAPMLLVSEGVVMVFVLTRRSTDKISVNPSEWLAAVGGTVSVMLVDGTDDPFMPGLGFALILAGFVVHTGAKLSLRRSFGIVPADRGIKSNGLYALVRHPMYTGYFISHVGFLLAAPTLWNAMVYSAAWVLFLTRMDFEERLLSANPIYRAYLGQVRWRMIVGVF